ncbi:MAG: hypothetical protein ACM4AI_23330 [Acidobacteriota bacterium]
MSARAIAAWFAMVPIAITNGGVRDILIVPAAGPAAGHVISTVMLCAAILLVTWITIDWMRPASLRDAARIGITWLALTLAFEFLAGHYVFGTPWGRLLADYNLAEGRVWILVPITTAIAPWLVARARHIVSPPVHQVASDVR